MAFSFVVTEANQEFIMAQGGISLLSITAADADDPQTLRMVAGAIANLCGNGMFVFFAVIWSFYFLKLYSFFNLTQPKN